MANSALGTPQGVPSSTDFMGSFKPPKTTSEAIQKEGEIISQLANATTAEGEAAAKAGVKKAELQAPILKQEAETQKAALGEFKSAAQGMQDLEFKPTQESLMSMTGIASLTAIIGLMLGKTGGFSGQSAIDSMTGMMKGYQAGKADIFKQEQATFEKNMQAQKANLEKLKGKLDTALKVAATDRQAAESDIAVMLAEIDSDFLKAKYNKEGLKGLLDSVSKLEGAMAKRDELAQRARLAETKAGGGDQSFLIYQYTGARLDPKKAAPEVANLAKSIGEADDLKEFVKNNADLVGRSGQVNQAIERYRDSWRQGYEPDDQGQPALIFAKRYAAYLVNYERSLAGGARGFTVQFQKRFNDLLKQDQFNAKGFEQLMDDQIRELTSNATPYSGNINRENMTALGRDMARRSGIAISQTTEPSSTSEKDQAIKVFGAYEPDKYTYGSDEKGFYRDKK